MLTFTFFTLLALQIVNQEMILFKCGSVLSSQLLPGVSLKCRLSFPRWRSLNKAIPLKTNLMMIVSSTRILIRHTNKLSNHENALFEITILKIQFAYSLSNFHPKSLFNFNCIFFIDAGSLNNFFCTIDRKIIDRRYTNHSTFATYLHINLCN